ncbi:MAG: C10 family peptidase [Candidatus Cloacimonetes bacterium]|nr:C10 family peptidase [Candidatus Cloacimonadota bacterium]MDD2506062.1 C10 family peptidase [Candidatus Cloacimonadota bacterium]MDD4559645.1 C10 family peptidase [Candidatus Cloacimonadota bacterium]
MKQLLLILSLLVWFPAAYALRVSEKEAIAIGNTVWTHVSAQHPSFATCLSYPNERDAEQADFYILSYRPQGFIMVSADDRVTPILAYSTSNNISETEIPDHIDWLLRDYAEAIREIRKNVQLTSDPGWDELRRGDTSRYSIQREVAPILQTTWNQDYPYNTLCPSEPYGSGGHAVAGCVATSMAQIMKRWSYPETGLGSHSYYSPNYGDQFVNFSNTTFDWDSMPNSIDSPNAAISTLMYCCGVAVDTQYGPDGSGAYVEDIPAAMVNYFRYHPTCSYHTASSYTQSIWTIMLRQNLDEGCPVLYYGYGSSGGHSFVLDGYQNTDHFHINWGWGGFWDGYYYLHGLNPDTHEFNQWHAAVMNIRPTNAATLTGYVRSSGSPVQDASINLEGSTFSAVTNSLGYYRIVGIPYGSYRVRVSKNGYVTQTQSVVFQSNSYISLDFELEEISTLEPPDNLQAELIDNNVYLSWDSPQAQASLADQGQSTRDLLGYKVYRNSVLIATIPNPTTCSYIDPNLPDGFYSYDVTARYDSGESTPASVALLVNWVVAPLVFEDSFETYDNFCTQFPPWTLLDNDHQPTYGILDHEYPNYGTEIAYMVFNPDAAVPPIPNMAAQQGSKFAAAFAALDTANDDWLISPALNLGTNSLIKFYARSASALYRPERFRVGISTDPAFGEESFDFISGPGYVLASTQWTEYCYDISAYDNQQAWIAIRCVSEDALTFMVDDFRMYCNPGAPTLMYLELYAGWNLCSLNISPTYSELPRILGNLASNVLQIKGTEGVWQSGNPYSSLSNLSDGRAYNILLAEDDTWIVGGEQIAPNIPIPLSEGWNLAAYYPTGQLEVADAMQSIAAHLQQVKGKDGIYIPANPYSTLSQMQPGKGYWIEVNSQQNLIYQGYAEQSQAKNDCSVIPEIRVLPSSMTIMARCDWATAGDILIAKVGEDLRGAQTLIDPEGFPAALLQVFCQDNEAIDLYIESKTGALLPVENRITGAVNAELGKYPEFYDLTQSPDRPDSPAYDICLVSSYPNPFQNGTLIHLNILKDDANPQLDIYNIKGQKVRSLRSIKANTGPLDISWDGLDDAGRRLSSGIYLCRLSNGNSTQLIKLMLLK